MSQQRYEKTRNKIRKRLKPSLDAIRDSKNMNKPKPTGEPNETTHYRDSTDQYWIRKPTGEQENIALHTAAAKLAGADGIKIKPTGEQKCDYCNHFAGNHVETGCGVPDCDCDGFLEPKPTGEEMGTVSTSCYSGNHDKCPKPDICECLCHQPKPTGEWTAETLWEFIGGKIDNLPQQLSKEDALACYKAITATLAAERELREEAERSRQRLQQAVMNGQRLNDALDQLAAAVEALRKIHAAVGPSEMVDIANAALAKNVEGPTP